MCEVRDRDNEKPVKYCPFCQRELSPANLSDVEQGLSDSFVWVHDSVPHDPDYDFKELN